MAVITSTALLAISVATAAASAAMQVRQANIADKAAKAQANAIKAEQNNAELEAAEASKRARITQKRTLSSLRARLAQTGTVTTEGTPLAILGENVANMELGFQDAARRTAMQSASMDYAAKNARWSGKQAKTSGYLAAAGTAINGAAGAFSQHSDNAYTGKTPDYLGLYKPKN